MKQVGTVAVKSGCHFLRQSQIFMELDEYLNIVPPVDGSWFCLYGTAGATSSIRTFVYPFAVILTPAKEIKRPASFRLLSEPKRTSAEVEHAVTSQQPHKWRRRGKEKRKQTKKKTDPDRRAKEGTWKRSPTAPRKLADAPARWIDEVGHLYSSLTTEMKNVPLIKVSPQRHLAK